MERNTGQTRSWPADEGHLRGAFDALAEGIAIYDSDRLLVSFNERYVEMLAPISEMIVPGLPWEDTLQACVAGGVYADASGRDAEWFANVGQDHARDVEIAHGDGRIYAVRYNPTPSGGFVVIRTDVTAAHQAADLLRESETLLRTILDTNPVPIVMARLHDGLILYRSPAAADLFGKTTYAREHYADPADRAAYVAALRRHRHVEDFRMPFRTATGETVQMSSNGRLTSFGGETVVVSTLLDLSESVSREAIIRKVVENCPAPILMTEAESGQVLFRGPEIDRLFGTLDNTHNFYVDPDDRNGFLEAVRKEGSVTDFKARFRDASGQVFWGAISARLIDYDGRDVIVSYSRDLTSQMELETDLSRQRERLFQQEKLSALGGLLANVSHALNNPLSVVVGHAQMLREESEDPAVVRQADKIGEAADRCSEIVRTYLTTTRQEPSELRPRDINEIVTAAVEVSRHGSVGGNIKTVCDLAPNLPQVLADGDLMTQVIINLLRNARAAIDDSGAGARIVLRTRVNPRSGCLQISVEDDGPGVERSIVRRIFEPFFTTRGIGNGTGIGLTFCHRIVQNHNGQIRLDETHHPGARFDIDLPAIRDGTPDSVSGPDDKNRARRVLVVDDEPEVADLNGEVLERVGYAVTVAHSGAEAIAALSNETFDCVLSDLNMPGIDGRGFFEIVRRDHPHLFPQIGFITGDTMGRASQAFLLESGRPYLEKPVSPRELRDFVASILPDGGST